MGGQHRHAAALQVAGNDARQPVDRSSVEGDEGFIEYPQRAFFLDQPGQCDAPLLALRQIFAGEILASGKADALSGCFIRVDDDLDALLAQADSIQSEGRLRLRLAE